MRKIAIGIDTGVNTGIAVWNATDKKFISIETMPIHQALRLVESYWLEQTNAVVVYFEDARKRRWIPDSHDIRREMGRRMGAGSVKRDAVIWEDFCRDLGITFNAIKPQAGATKLDAEVFARLTGWTKRTSNHSRDAAMLVFGK